MLDYNQYWKRLVSNGLRFLQGQGNADAVAVIKNAELDFDIVDHDNWDGGIDYWELRFRLKYKDFTALGDKKVKIENDIQKLVPVTVNNLWTNVRAAWQALLWWELCKKLTIKDVAKELGVSVSFVSDVEQGRGKLYDEEKRDKLIRILKLTEEDITLMNDLAAKGNVRPTSDPEKVVVCRDASDLMRVAFL